MKVRLCNLNIKFNKKKLISILDITQDEAYEVLRKCAKEIQTRLIINQPKFHVMVVDKNGVRKLEDITSDNLKN